MNFLHSEFQGDSNKVAVVTLDHQANIMLLDDPNFAAYKRGARFKYYGGWATKSPVQLSPPHYGHWHVVIDLGGDAGRVRAAVRIINGNG